jgi:hypothetical protein
MLNKQYQHQEKHKNSGVYKLVFNICNKSLGQMGKCLRARFN